MIIERVIVPVGSAYALFAGIALYAWRHPVPKPRRDDAWAVDLRPTVRYVVNTAVGGYLGFLAIVLVFHVAIAGQRGALRSAVFGGAFLAFGVASPIFIAGSWVSAAGGRRHPEDPRR